MLTVKTTIELLSDNDKKFREGCDIAFTYEGLRYIARIEDVGVKGFFGTKLERSGKPIISDGKLFLYDKVEKYADAFKKGTTN